MRPVELEVEGFTAYRDREVVNFEDAEFFALVGPTGSGKSSVIDAMCFALYGTVPRIDDRRMVAPVITQGATEARVRFTFAVGDRRYTAVRVVRRVGSGASTKEARLESGGEVLAGNADEVTAAVERLLGLPFEHFTRCVVLPQGEFARFLHDKPRERQDLLVRLLDLGVYGRMAQAANARAARAQGRLDQLAARLAGELAAATPEARAEAAARRQALAGLRAELAERQPEVDRLAADHRAAAAEADEAGRWAAWLGALAVPAEVASLAAEARAAQQALADARQRERAARTALDAVERARRDLPDPTPLALVVRALDERDRLVAQVTEADDALAAAVAADAAARRSLAEAEAAEVTARGEVEALRRRHAAHELAATLTVGEPCPVCEQAVARVPGRRRPAAVERAEAAAGEARRARESAARAASRSAGELGAAEARRKDVERRLADLDRTLDEAPPRDEIAGLLAAIRSADAALDRARAGEQAARRQVEARERAVAGLERSVEAARRAFGARRDEVVPLGPPTPAGADLAADWAELVEWAAAEAAERRAAAEAAGLRATEAERARQQAMAAMVDACERCGVTVGGRAPAEAALEAFVAAETRLARLDELVAEAEQARAEADRLGVERQVAHRLGQHLSAKGFEKWLLDEAMELLVAGATEILADLTGGQYALGVDRAGSFLVVDHHNAGEARLARTLSGGETFLASLALALALADHLATLAAGGGGRLEAIFLDEGFGTLDAETLDTVAAAMENLGATGRVVGLVTHVRELAERVPVRFEVTKDVRSARVERVVA